MSILTILRNIPNLKVMKKDDALSDYNLIANIISIFADYMKVIAPKNNLDAETLEYYLEITVNWLENFSEHLSEINENLSKK
jgi:hypothetical protein